MTEKKKYLSVFGTLSLMMLPAWVFARLFYSMTRWPMSFVISAVLLLEIGMLWLTQRVRKHGTSSKSVFGVLFCVSLGVVLGFGLLTSVSYIVEYLIDGSVGTSFPWYTGFAFAGMFGGPVILIFGIIWVVMHLRERKRNIKDIRLLVFLILVGTAAWAVLWTIDRIRCCFVYPHAYNHPWYASFAFCMLYFGPWLLLEGGLFALAKHFEKGLKPEDMAAEPPKPVEPKPRNPIRWGAVLADAAVIVVPLAVAAVLMAALWDTGYLAYNIAVMVCNATTVCLLLGLTAWLVYHQFEDSKKLRGICILSGVLFLVTFAAMIVWTIWYTGNRLNGLTGLPQNFVYTLAVGFFGPVLLGEAIMTVLLYRVSNRLAEAVTEQKFSASWALLLAGVLVLNCAVLWVQLETMDYIDEIDVTAKKVSYPESHREGNFMVDFVSDYDIAWIRYWEEESHDDSYYLTYATTWNPFREIRRDSVGHNFYPEEEVDKFYVYKPGVGFELILVKDLETGLWEFYG